LTAPGTCPATASRLDLARETLGAAHVDERLAAREGVRDTRGVQGHLRPRARLEACRRARRVPRVYRPAFGRPGGEPAVEHGDRVVAQPAQHPPKPRCVGARARVVADDLRRVADAEPAQRLRELGGRGKRVASRGVRHRRRQVALEVDVDGAGDVARAPGLAAGLGRAELEAAVRHEPVRVGQPAGELPG
jgi:hypothetical protein